MHVRCVQVVSSSSFARREVHAVCGPSADDLAPFAWSDAQYRDAFVNVSREGVAERFAFGWQRYAPHRLPERARRQ